jgi:mono/diheme cytochrome c family protein
MDAEGEVYICQMSSVGGHIYRLGLAGSPPKPPAFPPLLSQTGAFADLAGLRPAGEWLPYAVNVPFWSDGALKRRWFSVPSGKQVRFSPGGEWTFPAGSVFMKHFELPLDDTNPRVTRRLETRFLVCDAQGGAYGVTYKWRADGRDAELLTNALTEEYPIRTAAGTRQQRWYYPSRADCMTCHTKAANYVLGANTRQLNGNLAYPEATDNQLRTLNHLGLVETPLEERDILKFQQLAPPGDATVSLERRVKSYLDANCAQCHRPGGVAVSWDARYEVGMRSQGIINGFLRNQLNLPDAENVCPGHPERSVLYQRVQSTAAG